MSDETVYNLLRGTSAQAQTSTEYVAFKFALTKALEVGKTYTFSVDVDELSNSMTDSPYIGPNDGNGHVRYCTLYGTGHKVGTFTVGNLNYESVYDFASFAIYNTPGLYGTWSATNRLVIRNAMLVEGDTPAAWAPAEGETLAGGGALMSANLLEGKAMLPSSGATYADGVLSVTANGTTSTRAASDTAVGGDVLSENQTCHVGASLRVASGAACKIDVGVEYRDGADNRNWTYKTVSATETGGWQRIEFSIVVPSGMRMVDFFVHTKPGNPAFDLTAPTLSYGSPVTLASSAHTPYATQDHVSVTYATKASLKVTDDSIKAEVAQRTKTDQMVSDLSSKLTQTADGFNASIDRLSDTDKKVNSWFGFGADASGNPQLTMGSSSSPVVGVYTNAGLAYKARSGATLLELDGASRSSTMPHVHADDVSMGSWQWVPTQNGTHFTLQWIGG